MAFFGPAPELAENETIELVKGPLGGSVSVMVGPTPDQGVELAEERLLGESQSGLDAEPDFVPPALHAALCGDKTRRL